MTWVRKQRVGGTFLGAGAVLFLLFWWAPASAGDPLIAIGPWPLQLAIHGLSMAFTAAGLAFHLAFSDLAGRSRGWFRIGVVSVALGMLVNHVILAAGVVLIGTILVRNHLRLPGAALIAGGLSWASVYASGASVGNEDNPPLEGVLRWVAMFGLVAIFVGLLVLGLSELRRSHPRVAVPTAQVV